MVSLTNDQAPAETGKVLEAEGTRGLAVRGVVAQGHQSINLRGKEGTSHRNLEEEPSRQSRQQV